MPSEHHTEETGCGLLPTPNASEAIEAAQKVTGKTKTRKSGQTYTAELKDLGISGLLPTPNATEATKYTTKLNPNSQMGMGLTAQAMNGLLPTPMATDIYHQKRVTELKKKNVSFHSRANGETRPNGLMDYLDFQNLLPTPRANKVTECNLNNEKLAKRNKGNLEEVIAKEILNKTDGQISQLNPLFVEEMMGYPLMWTALPFLSQDGDKKV